MTLINLQPARLVGREYPTLLRQLLRARYITQTPDVNNQGLPGEFASSSSALSRFISLAVGREFDVVLLMEGANDICFCSPNPPPGVAAAVANLRRMITEARNRGMQVLLATLPPVNPAGARGAIRNQLLPQLNAEIRSLAASHGVPLVDVFEAFGNDMSLLGSDGLHPNADGYARIAAKFFDVIRERFETPHGLAPLGIAPPSSLQPTR